MFVRYFLGNGKVYFNTVREKKVGKHRQMEV